MSERKKSTMSKYRKDMMKIRKRELKKEDKTKQSKVKPGEIVNSNLSGTAALYQYGRDNISKKKKSHKLYYLKYYVLCGIVFVFILITVKHYAPSEVDKVNDASETAISMITPTMDGIRNDIENFKKEIANKVNEIANDSFSGLMGPTEPESLLDTPIK